MRQCLGAPSEALTKEDYKILLSQKGQITLGWLDAVPAEKVFALDFWKDEPALSRQRSQEGCLLERELDEMSETEWWYKDKGQHATAEAIYLGNREVTGCLQSNPFMGELILIALAHSSEDKAGEGPWWPSAEWPCSEGPCFPPGKSTVSVPCAVTQPASSAPGPRKALRGESNTSRGRQVIRQSRYWGITHCHAATGLGRLESARSLVTRF